MRFSSKALVQATAVTAAALAAGVFGTGSAHATVLAYYNFNDGSNAATVPDNSGNGNTGNVQQQAVYTAVGTSAPVDGGTGRAMSFDGSGDRILISNGGTAFDALATANRVTVSFWTLGPAASQPRAQTNFGAYNVGVRQVQAHVPWSDSNIYFDTGGCCDPNQHRINKVATESDFEDSPGIPGADWDHWVFVKDGNTKSIYVNNALFHSGTNTAPIGDITDFAIGGEPGGANSYLGLMDDFIVLDEALPATGARSVNTLFTQGGAALVPEPAAVGLLAVGALSLLARRRRAAC